VSRYPRPFRYVNRYHDRCYH